MNVSLIDVPIAYGKHFVAEALQSVRGKPSAKNMPVTVHGDHVEFKYRNGEALRFYYDSDARLLNIMTFLNEVFIGDVYKPFDVKDRVVVDIGANIGDTAIYFALNGAKKVYSYEAVPKIFEAAKRNIKANNLEGKIDIYNEAAGQPGTYVTIAAEEERAGEIKPADTGIRVKCSDLAEITKRAGAKGAALKLDCEGCEYDLILNAKDETLKSYSEIVMEYHYGYKDIAKRLRDAGFDVRVKRPIYVHDANSKKPDLMLGILWAKAK